MMFPPKLLDDIRDAVPLRNVIGRRTRLERAGKYWKACCPFHGEKTPSFYIYEDHFHCYGCGAHGDVFSFLMQNEGLSFSDAVAALAAEAGLELPKPDARQVQQSEETARLRGVLQEAALHYQQCLQNARGQAAQAYLARRGTQLETIAQFGLGWAESDDQALVHRLKAKGYTTAEIFKAGLWRTEGGGAAFFSRVMFPIHDRRGQIISFGGRTLGDAQPKYVNGAETLLFSKKRTLYNLHNASVAVRKDRQPLLVVEGYMDVIALAQAGFTGAVAPLGTSIAEEQLALMWRESSSPVICLDGDAAGDRAALRVAELALPALSADKTLRFCRLPAGHDPDSLIKSEGPDAMRALVDNAASLLDTVFARLREDCNPKVPESRAVLRQRLDEMSAKIADRTLGYEYRRSWRDKVFESFRVSTWRSLGIGARKSQTSMGAQARPNVRENSSQTKMLEGDVERCKILTTMILTHPDLLNDVEQDYLKLNLSPELLVLREKLVEWSSSRSELSGLNAENPVHWFESQKDVSTEFANCASRAQALKNKYDQLAGLGAPQDDQLLNVSLQERWFHFYMLVEYPHFRNEVLADVEAVIADQTLEALPESVKARLMAFGRLSVGESPDDL